MAMPRARQITVKSKTYDYLVKVPKGYKPHLKGWSSKRIRLIVELNPSKHVSLTFESKAWTSEHEHDPDTASAHRASFTPADVAAVIRTLTFDTNRLPGQINLPGWKQVE